MISISAALLASDASTLDFNSTPAGPISSTASLFTNFGLDAVSLVGTFTVTGDELDTGDAGHGNALGPQSSTLAILNHNAPLDYISVNSGFRFELNGTARQFGFRIID